MSAMWGTLFPSWSKVSKVKSTFASWAIAIKCNTALVLPPRASTVVTAFLNASMVIISLGLISFFRR
jgi:hypothetical protein